MQRAQGEGRIAVSFKGGRTRLDDLYQSGAAKIRLPGVHDGTHAEAVLINVSGGLTGGDRFSWRADLAPETALCITTQACEKIYRATGGHAEIQAHLKLDDGAALSWLPQEAILFEHSAVERTIDAAMAPSARLLILESAILGRQAMGERPTQTGLQDRWRISIDGHLVHAEETRISGNPALSAAGAARLNADQLNAAGLNAMTAFASLVLIAPDAGHFTGLLRALPAIDGTQSAISHLPAFQSAKLVARFVARDGLALRRALIPAVECLNRTAMRMGGLPKVWRL
jgi:urease accessory protein